MLQKILRIFSKPRYTDIYVHQTERKVVDKPQKVSVIIPNYNYARYLSERMDSILFQTYPVHELIILDDCSTDHSMEVIQEKLKKEAFSFPVRVFQNQSNSGNVFAQWKRAFQEADGDYIWIAEADDSCHAEFLEAVMQSFEDSEVVISYCESLTMDEENRILMNDLRTWIDLTKCGKWNCDYIKDGIEEICETMCINNTIANVSGVVFKKGEYDSFLDEAMSFQLAGDWYVYMRVLEAGKIAYHHRSLNYHRMHKQGVTLSTKNEKEFEEIVRLQEYAMAHYPVTDEVKKKALERREKVRMRFGL